MLTLHKRYIRTSPTGDQTIVIINTPEKLTYQTDLVAEGFIYKEIIPTVIPGSTCVSCEG